MRFRLALTSVVQLTPPTRRQHEARRRGSPGGTSWRLLTGSSCRPARSGISIRWSVGTARAHANDGPASAYVVLADGSTRAVTLGATDRAPRPRVGAEAPPALSLIERDGVAAAAWEMAATCEQRVHPHDAVVLSSDGDPVSVAIADGFAPEQYEIAEQGEQFHVRAGSRRALQWALLALARHRRGELGVDRRPPRAAPRMAGPPRRPRPAVRAGCRCRVADRGRGVAPPEPIAPAPHGRRGMARARARLSGADGRRCVASAIGHAVPPLLGSGADATGGWYSSGAIATLGRQGGGARDRSGAGGRSPRSLLRRTGGAARAARSGRCVGRGERAALRRQRAQPRRRGDVAVPRGGVRRAGRPLPVAVAAPRRRRGAARGVAALAAAQRWAAGRGIDGTDAIAAAFLRQVIDMVRASTGRAGRRVAGGRRERRARSGRRVRRRLEVGRRRPPTRVGRPPRRRRAGAVVLPRPRRRRRLVVAGGELGRPGVDGRHRAVRRDRRLVGRGAGGTARHPSLPVDRTRPRPRHPPPPPPPAPHRHRRRPMEARQTGFESRSTLDF